MKFPTKCIIWTSSLDSVDLVVLLVGHDEIKQNMDKLQGKVVFDTRHICNNEGYIDCKEKRTMEVYKWYKSIPFSVPSPCSSTSWNNKKQVSEYYGG